MDDAAVTLICLVVFGWGLFSARLGRADLSAPMVFIAAGLLFSEGLQIEPDVSREAVKLIAEVTLVWVLFADASRLTLRDLRPDRGLYTRLLAVGLPLTVAAGTGLAMLLFDGLGIWMALLVGAALAPTDAALGATVMTDPAVPERVRRALNVESGLNDGIATPIVTVAIAGAAATAVSGHNLPTVSSAVVDLIIGLVVGLVVGVVGGKAMRLARLHKWASEDAAGPGVLALALTAYAVTLLLDGNGFVAAFVAGIAFGNSAGRGGSKEVFYVEQTAGLASTVTWFLFGALAVPTVFEQADWQIVVYALLSLTVVRMLPVALALIGERMSRPTVAFIGWFGPRGLASIIFALIALEELGDAANRAVAIVGMTVVLSVLAHGLTAKPLAVRYGATTSLSTQPAGTAPSQLPVRGLLQRHSATSAKASSG